MKYMKCPNMEAARLKIVAVLKEHDIMGAVMIAGKERSGFFHEISPTWSCAKIAETPQGVGVHIKSQRGDYPSLEAQELHLALTVNGLLGMLHVHKFIGEMITGIVTLIGQKVDIQSVAHDECVQTVSAPNSSDPFVEWEIEVRRIGRLLGYDDDQLPELSDIDLREYFERGRTPAEWWQDEIDAGGEMD